MAATYTLTAGQRAVWHAAVAGAGAALHVCRRVRLDGPVGPGVVTDAVQLVCSRLEVLHRRYEGQTEECRCRSVGRSAVPVQIVDAVGLAPREAGRQAEQYAALPFDLAREIALRVLVQRADTGAWLTFVAHHLVLDGWSLDQIVRDVLDALAGGAPEARASMDDASGASSALPDGDWPAMPDRVLDEVASDDTTAAVNQIRLDQAVADGLRRHARTHGISTAHALMAIFAAALHSWADLEEIAFLTPVDVRGRAQRHSLGMGVNSIVVGSRLEAAATFVDFAKALRDRFLDSYALREHAVVDLARRAGMARRADGTSVLTDFEFNYMRAWRPSANLAHAGLTAYAEPHIVPAAQYDLSLSAIEDDGIEGNGIELCWQVRGNTSGAETARLLHQLFARCAAAFAADPLAVVAQVPLLSESQIAAVLARGAGPEAPVDTTPIVSRVLRYAQSTPEQVAIVSHGSSCTYAELGQSVRAARQALIAAGVQPGSRVVVWMERGRSVVEAMLAIWSVGAVYVPIDVGNPRERVLAMLRQVAADFVVLDVVAHAGSIDVGVPVILLGSVLPGYSPSASTDVEHAQPQPSDAAYIMFTSGSTGLPKAVAIHHAGMVNHLYEMVRVGGVAQHDIFGQLAPLAFDVHIWQLLAPLVLGGTLRIVSQEELADPIAVAGAIEREGITVLQAVPSYLDTWGHLADVTGASGCPSLRTLYVTGETFTRSLAARLRRMFPNAALINAYGPAEASDDVALHVVEDDVTESVVPIGTPIANARLYVIDRWGRLRPPGLRGELAIGGLAVGLGYLGEDARPAFGPDPWRDGGALYRTGDVCALRDGVVHFFGRQDYQVKLGGRRVELGEIEAACGALPGVTAAHALLAGEGVGRLVCFLTAAHRLDAPSLQAALREVLPGYMVPRIVQIDSLPTTRNGKVDQEALRGLVETSRPADASSDLHDVVRSAWVRALGTDKFDLDDNFFRLGGDSLRALSVIADLRALGIPAEIAALYHAQSLRGFLQSFAVRDGGAASLRTLRVVLPDFVQQHDLERFVQGVRLTIDGDVEQVEYALRQAVHAHAVLRSAIERTSQGWVLSRENLSTPHGRRALPGEDLEAAALRELSLDNLVAWAVRPEGAAVDVALAVHHAVADDESLSLLIGDVQRSVDGARLDEEAHFFGHCLPLARAAGQASSHTGSARQETAEGWSSAAVLGVPSDVAMSRVRAAVTAQLVLWWSEATGAETVALGAERDLRFGARSRVRGVGCHVGLAVAAVHGQRAEIVEVVDACESALAAPPTDGAQLDGLDLLVNVVHVSTVPKSARVRSIRRMSSVPAINRASSPVPAVIDLVCDTDTIEVLLHVRDGRVERLRRLERDGLQARLDAELPAALATSALPAGHDLVDMDTRELRGLLDQLAGREGG